MSVREFSCSRGNNPKALEQVFERQENKMSNNVDILTDFVKPLENSVLDEFMAFSEKLLDNGILLDVKDIIALFKMLKEAK
jgi:hypothetical protein